MTIQERKRQQDWLLDHQDGLEAAFGTRMFCTQCGADCVPEDFSEVFSVYDSGKAFMDDKNLRGMGMLEELMESGLFQSVDGKYVFLDMEAYRAFARHAFGEETS